MSAIAKTPRRRSPLFARLTAALCLSAALGSYAYCGQAFNIRAAVAVFMEYSKAVFAHAAGRTHFLFSIGGKPYRN